MARGWVRAGCVGVAVVSPVASHAALALGQGYGVAVGLAAVQAVAGGWLIRGALPGRRWVGAAVSVVLLVALGLGSRWSAADGLLVVAGVSHAVLYAGLMAVFGGTLRAGRESLVTGLARRINPGFHAGMVPYTRAVTVAWCGFFGLQLVLSAVLLVVSPRAWLLLVTTVHAPLVLAMAVGELLVRRWRWRGEPAVGLRAMVAGIRAIRREGRAGGGRTSGPG